MLYVLYGLVAAMVYGIGTFSLYGYEGVMLPGAGYVFWGLIGAGALFSALDNALGLGRLRRRTTLDDSSAPYGSIG